MNRKYSITYLTDRLVTETCSSRTAAVRRARIVSVNGPSVFIWTPARNIVCSAQRGYASDHRLNEEVSG